MFDPCPRVHIACHLRRVIFLLLPSSTQQRIVIVDDVRSLVQASRLAVVQEAPMRV